MNQRYYSLDVFRGATVALMILVNNPGSWSHIYAPLEHAAWHGCTPTDLVFPFFLFAVGNAMAFVMPKFEKEGAAFFWKKVIKRTVLIFLIGLLLNWSPFVLYNPQDQLVLKGWEWITKSGNIAGIRVMGVLQRIALSYFFASVIVYYCKTKGAFVVSGIILLIYWLLSFVLGDAADPYTLQGFFGTNVDIRLFGVAHVYKGEGVPFDPEGLVSTTAAIVQVIFGYLTGQYIQQKGKSFEMLTHLFVAGAVLLLVGYCWDMVYPINKKIWTSSYTIYTSGLAIISLAVLIYLIEFKEKKNAFTKFFDVFGKNPLFIFVLSGFLPRVLALIRIQNAVDPVTGKPVYLPPFGWFYEHICKNIATDLRMGSLVYALGMIAFYWSIVYVMDKKKIYVKV
jgi:predicted acyltransferase